MKQGKDYYENLKNDPTELIKELITDAYEEYNGPEGWRPNNECFEEIECHRRDGFIPFSHNMGGIIFQNFTDLMSYWSTGHEPAHEKAGEEIQSQIKYSFECLRDGVFEEFKALLTKYKIPKEACEYHNILELSEKHKELEPVVQAIEDREPEFLSDETSSIMHEIRFMYHGNEDGVHMASVSAALNTEGPYHRSGISWAPKVFCEGAKEIEITWKSNKELKRKLKATLATVCKAIF